VTLKIGIIGSGVVGQQLGGKLASLGHDVVLGTRDPHDLQSKKGLGTSLAEWSKGPAHGAKISTFAKTAEHGDLVINATSGTVSLEALKLAGAQNLAGKILVDVSNELDYSHGMPPIALATDRDGGSVAVSIQKAFPTAKVVKTFNTMSAWVMVDPQQLAGGDHTVFISGNDSRAKETVSDLLRSFGWRDIFDLGDINTAHGPEMFMALWTRCWKQIGTRPFNFKVVR
jgi:8-hydroxy-5-deazaflavin:NADPH oxidoreductase